jgi:Secretion system C-terminal sorting domain/Kelch motif
MKRTLLLGLGVLLSVAAVPQSIPDIPIPVGLGSAEVHGGYIYYFGGSTSWSGSTRYSTVYRYDGESWENYASMPDNDVWGISSAVKGDSAFVYGGYAFGNNILRIYNFTDNSWEYATSSPDIHAYSGHTMEYYDNDLYMFYKGSVYIYDISGDSWSEGTALAASSDWLFSTMYQDEIFLVGWANAKFYKYNPHDDQWTPLADLPYYVSGGALSTVDDKIYYVAGTSGSQGGTFSNTLVYDIGTDQWSDAGISVSGKRDYLAPAFYKNNLYVIGGLDSVANAVDNVEFIVAGIHSAVDPYYYESGGFGLSQNYPNPFSSFTTIHYTIPYESQNNLAGSPVTLKIYDMVGEEVAILVNEMKPAGSYDIEFDGSKLSTGVYFYKLQSGSFSITKKLHYIQ